MAPFVWEEFKGRARRRLAAGLVVLLVGLVYAGWAGARLARKGSERAPFDAVLVAPAAASVPVPYVSEHLRPGTPREAFLMTTVAMQHDSVQGLVVFLTRCAVALTIAGCGLVLLTAGSTEWELRSRLRVPPPAAGPAD